MTYHSDQRRRRRRLRQRRFYFANSRVGRHLTRRRVLTETCLRDYTHPRVSDLINLTLDKEIARHD